MGLPQEAGAAGHGLRKPAHLLIQGGQSMLQVVAKGVTGSSKGPEV